MNSKKKLADRRLEQLDVWESPSGDSNRENLSNSRFERFTPETTTDFPDDY